MPWSWPCKPWSSACSASWSLWDNNKLAPNRATHTLRVAPRHGSLPDLALQPPANSLLLILLYTTHNTHTTYLYQVYLLLLFHRALPIPYDSYYYTTLLYTTHNTHTSKYHLWDSYYLPIPDFPTTLITQGPAHSLLLTLLFTTHNWYSYHHYYRSQISFLFPRSLIIVWECEINHTALLYFLLTLLTTILYMITSGLKSICHHFAH